MRLCPITCPPPRQPSISAYRDKRFMPTSAAGCITSTGASLRAGVIGGLAALTGSRHGATTARGEAMWDEVGENNAGRKMRDRLARGDDLPGFCHHLYPNDDVRATSLPKGRLIPGFDLEGVSEG